MSSNIKPFKISVSDEEIAAAKQRLATTRFPHDGDVLQNWEFGAPLSDVKRLAEYWKDGFDWRKQEEKLNKLPQFTTTVNVDGFGDLDIHFLHQRSANPDSIPFLFVHGWPGSFLEVEKILPLLTAESKDSPSFHVVAPSLPNFGFSQGVSKPGFSIPQYAETCHKVMQQLGYEHYVTQGGDWGFLITRLISHLYPTHNIASHINFVYAFEFSFAKQPLLWLRSLLTPKSAYVKKGFERTNWFLAEGQGYNRLQSTKPSTISFSLADSPVGTLAWIYEKLHDWTDSYPWTDDEVLTWIHIYWFSKAGPGASARIYYEAAHAENETTKKAWDFNSQVPLGTSIFPRDILVYPNWYGQTLGKVVFEKFHEDGGHFAAWERPERLVEDLKAMFGKGGGAEQVAKRFEGKK